jgi:hypothetical protein
MTMMKSIERKFVSEILISSNVAKNSIQSLIFTANISMINDEEESEEEDVPTVMIGNKSYPLTEVMDNTELIQRMQPHEKDRYIEIYQEYFQDLHD